MTLPAEGSTLHHSLERAVERCFGVPADEARGILEALQPCVCRGGDWLFRQGDAGDALYLLARGRLQVWIEGDDHGGGPVAEVAPGETVGEISLLTGGSRSAGIRAVRDSLLLRMDAATLDRLGRERPALIRQLAGGLALRLRERTATGHGAQSRHPRTLAVLPLGPAGALESVIRSLGVTLGRNVPTIVVSGATLGALGAPALPDGAGDAVSAAMAEWLAGLEDGHGHVILLADAGDTAWTRLALRHADLVLLAARSADEPVPRDFERALLAAPDWPAATRALLLVHEKGRAPAGTARWLADRNLAWHLHLREDSPEDLARVARVLGGDAVGLVLGGGAARGFAHLGVFRALREAGIPVDWIGGASIGAVLGLPIAQGLDPAEAIDIVRRAFVGGRPFGDFTLPVVSLLRGGRLDRLLAEHVSGDIEDLPLPFFCVSSNLGDGALRVHSRGPIAAALRAGVSLPGVFPPAVVDGQLTVDGGILDNLPVDLMQRQPVARVIAVDVTSRQTYRVDYEAVPSPWRLLAGRLLPFARRYRVPGFLSLMLKATEIGTMAAVRASGARADLLLRPPVGRFGFTDVRSFDAVVETGYRDACEKLAASGGRLARGREEAWIDRTVDRGAGARRSSSR